MGKLGVDIPLKSDIQSKISKKACISAVPERNEYCVADVSNIRGSNVIYTKEELIWLTMLFPNNIINVKVSKLKNGEEDVVITKLPDKYAECNKFTDEKLELNDKAGSKVAVKDLTEGYILSKSLYTPISEPGKVVVTESSPNMGLIASVGSVLNNTKLGLIRKYYSDECEIPVMDAVQVRQQIASQPIIRRTLASFYANTMKKPKYMHLEYFKNNVKEYFDSVRNIPISVAELREDPNLLYILYNLYGYHMYTYEHSVCVGYYACLLYNQIYFGKVSDKEYEETLFDLFLAALLHDTGKIYVGIQILDKEGRLSKEEQIEMDEHPKYSRKVAENFCRCDSPIAEIYKHDKDRRDRLIAGIYYHHTKLKSESDKRSYPVPGNKGPSNIVFNNTVECQEELSPKVTEFCALLSIADCLDGMTSPRPYRGTKAEADSKTTPENKNDYLTMDQAMQLLRTDANAGKLDIEKVTTLINTIEDHNLDIEDKYGAHISGIQCDQAILDDTVDITKDPNYVK